MPSDEQINGFVLAGGKSSRMGQDKALLRLQKKPLVVHLAEILRPFVHKVAILGPGRYRNFGLPVIPDIWPDQGPLAGVATGLIFSDAAWNIFLACDLPSLSPGFIQLLIQRVRATRFAAVVPRTDDGWQPLSAAYHMRCERAFTCALREGRRSMVELLEEVQVDVITRDEMMGAGLSSSELLNINTPEDWAGLERREGNVVNHAERR